jgi:hypothetical protein
LILEDIRSENHTGWSVEENEIYGRQGFIEEALKKINKKTNLVATYATGASKCNVKKLKDV